MIFSVKNIIISRHVTFDESSFPFRKICETRTSSYDFLESGIYPILSQIFQNPTISGQNQPRSPATPQQTCQPETIPIQSSSEPRQPGPTNPLHPPPRPTSHHMTTGSKGRIVKPNPKYGLSTHNVVYTAQVAKSPIPRSHIDALNDKKLEECHE